VQLGCRFQSLHLNITEATSGGKNIPDSKYQFGWLNRLREEIIGTLVQSLCPDF